MRLIIPVSSCTWNYLNSFERGLFRLLGSFLPLTDNLDNPSTVKHTHMMQGHASLNIGPVSVRNNTLHGGRCRQWSASYPGDLPTVVLLKARVARTAFRVSSVTVLRAAAWMARKCHRSVAYRLILSASCPTGVHAESAGARKKGASASKDKSKQKKKNSNNRPKYNHSKIATDIFKEWFYAHMHHPFPSDEVKAEFADRTGMPIATARLLSQRRWGL